MALCREEGTDERALKAWKMPSGYDAGYLRIIHIGIEYRTKQVDLIIMGYKDKQARLANEDSGYAQGRGWTLTDEDIEQMKSCDNRDVLYPALEEKLIKEYDNEGTA